jgi:Inovirus Gp2
MTNIDQKKQSGNKLMLMTSSLSNNESTLRCINKDYDDIFTFKSLNKVSQYISKSSHNVYFLKNDLSIEVKSISTLKIIFNKLNENLNISAIESILPIHSGVEVNAWIDILIRANEKLKNGYFFFTEDINKICYEQKMQLRVDGLNRFISWIRRLSKFKIFKTIERNHRRKEGKNERGIHAFMKEVWQRYADLNIVRIDLEYKKYNPYWFELGTSNDISVDLAIEHRGVFLERLDRHPLLAKKLGYIMKLEYGFRGGLHFHVLLIFNGQSVQDDIGYGRLACELWAEVTDGRGKGWNCNSHKDRYARMGTLGIGRIRHYETELRQHLLEDVLDYFTKLDALRKLKLGNRALVKSLSPLPKADERGRPRKLIRTALESDGIRLQ